MVGWCFFRVGASETKSASSSSSSAAAANNNNTPLSTQRIPLTRRLQADERDADAQEVDVGVLDEARQQKRAADGLALGHGALGQREEAVRDEGGEQGAGDADEREPARDVRRLFVFW